MGKLKTYGGFSDDAVAAAKAAMIAENFDFSEEVDTQPSVRSGAGYPTMGGFIEQHFDFARCQRPDGSFYGSPGRCVKGTDAGAKQEEPKKSKAKSSGGDSGGGDSGKSGGGDAKTEAKGGGGGGGEATAADLKTKVKMEDPTDDWKEKTMTLGDLKKGGVGNDKLDALEAEVRAGSSLTDAQKEAGARVLKDDHKAILAEIKASGVSDKEMNALLTGGPRDKKQELLTQEDMNNSKYSGKGGQQRIYAKINNDLRKDAKDLIENEGKYNDLIAKVRSGKASDAEKAKYAKMFPDWAYSPKQVDRTMANVAKINKARGGGGKSDAKPAAKSGGAAKPKAKKEAAPKKPKGGGTYSSSDMKKLDNGALRQEAQRLYKVTKGKSKAKYDAYESFDKVNAELRARGLL